MVLSSKFPEQWWGPLALCGMAPMAPPDDDERTVVPVDPPALRLSGSNSGGLSTSVSSMEEPEIAPGLDDMDGPSIEVDDAVPQPAAGLVRELRQQGDGDERALHHAAASAENDALRRELEELRAQLAEVTTTSRDEVAVLKDSLADKDAVIIENHRKMLDLERRNADILRSNGSGAASNGEGGASADAVGAAGAGAAVAGAAAAGAAAAAAAAADPLAAAEVESLRKSLADITQGRDDLAAEKDMLQGDLMELAAMADELAAAKDAAREENERLRGEVTKAAVARAKEIEDVRRELESSRAASRDELAALQGSVKARDADIKKLRKTVEQLNLKIPESEKPRDSGTEELLAERDATQAAKSKEISAKEAAQQENELLRGLTAKLKEISEAKDAALRENELLRNKVAEMADARAKEVAVMDDAKGEEVENLAEIANAKAQEVENLEKELETFKAASKESMKAKDAAIKQLHIKLDEISAETDAMLQENELLHRKVADAAEARARDAEKLQKEMDTSKAIRKWLSAMKDSVEAKDATIEDLHKVRTELNSKVLEANNETAAKKFEIEGLLKSLAGFAGFRDKLLAEKEEMQAKLEELTAKMEEATTARDSALRENGALHGKVAGGASPTETETSTLVPSRGQAEGVERTAAPSPRSDRGSGGAAAFNGGSTLRAENVASEAAAPPKDPQLLLKPKKHKKKARRKLTPKLSPREGEGGDWDEESLGFGEIASVRSENVQARRKLTPKLSPREGEGGDWDEGSLGFGEIASVRNENVLSVS